MPKDVGAFAAALAELRNRTQRCVADAEGRQAIMDELGGPKGQQTFRRGGVAALRRKWRRLLRAKGYWIVPSD
jgi:hypothetical protein